MALNLKSIVTIPTYDNRTKGELEEINGTLDFFCTQSMDDNETLVSFTLKETPDKFYFASSALKNFLIDNVDSAEISDTGAMTFSETVTIKFNGKKKAKKSNREFNDWIVTVK